MGKEQDSQQEDILTCYLFSQEFGWRVQIEGDGTNSRQKEEIKEKQSINVEELIFKSNISHNTTHNVIYYELLN